MLETTRNYANNVTPNTNIALFKRVLDTLRGPSTNLRMQRIALNPGYHHYLLALIKMYFAKYSMSLGKEMSRNHHAYWRGYLNVTV